MPLATIEVPLSSSKEDLVKVVVKSEVDEIVYYIPPIQLLNMPRIIELIRSLHTNYRHLREELRTEELGLKN